MRRVLILAALIPFFVAFESASAQHGGMHGGGARGGGHGGFVARGGVGHRAAPAFSAMPTGFGSRTFFGSGGFGEEGSHEGFRGGFHHHHHCFRCWRSSWYAGYGYPGYYSPYLWWDTYSDDYRFDEEQAREIALAEEMNRLNIEEERLREREEAWERERAEDAYARRPRTREQVSSQPAPATVLVFRDGHNQEVQDYAIAGQTLWILSEESAKKVPLSELDLDATRKVNDDRGVEFQMPSDR